MDDQNSEFKKAMKSISSILSKRSHSLQDLKQKLSLKYSSSVVTQAVEMAKKNNWLESEDALSEKVTTTLHEKNKSWFYIKNYLKEKGLPLPEYNREKEMEKSHRLLLKKFPTDKLKNQEEQQKAKRFLLYRGFEEDIIKEVLTDNL